MPTLDHAVVLVTGANSGLGTRFVHQALERGAAKVYAAARTPRKWDDDRIVPVRLDVTVHASVTAAANLASDVTVVINNAGALNGSSLLAHRGDHRPSEPDQPPHLRLVTGYSQSRRLFRPRCEAR